MDERQQILQMLGEGTINATEAAALLDALQPAPRRSIPPDAPLIDGATGKIIEPAAPPDFSRLRRFWLYPFAAAVALVAVCGLLLGALYSADGWWATLGLFCVWPALLLGITATVLSLWSKYAPWVHVRVRQKDGRRIAVSLPLPLNLARWGIGFAARFVPADQAGNLQMAAGFLDQFEGGDPLIVSVDDEDGDQVQVYIG